MAGKLIAGLLALAFLCPATAWSAEHGQACDLEQLKGPIVQEKHNEGEEGSGNLNLGGFSNLSGILGVGQALRDGLNKTSATTEKGLEAQSKYFRSLLVTTGSQREAARNQKVFGEQARSYNSFKNESFEAGVRNGLAAEGALSDNAKQDLQDHSREFDQAKHRKQWLTDLSLQDNPFVVDQTMTAQELSDSKDIAKTVLDPIPALNVPEGADDSQGSEDYESIRKARDARLLLPDAVLGDVLAAKAPVMDLGEWPAALQERTGVSLEEEDGKISSNALMQALSDVRFANQDWLAGPEGLHGKTKVGVLREILQSRIDKLMLEYKKMRWMDRMAAVMVQRQLSKNEILDRAEKKLRSKAVTYD